MIQKIHQKIDYLKKRNINVECEKSELSPEQEFQDKVVRVFHKFDMLDNYTDHRWFLYLSLDQLKKLYRACEDVWNFRAQLSPQNKAKIVHGGMAFHISLGKIFNFSHLRKRKLQNIILNEFDRFVTQGHDENERKLGAMLMLTALVEVSNDAAYALPQFVQHD